jgi:hypothetical protein
MALSKRKFAGVDPEVGLFRFLDFTKYVSMLDHGALFFTRADELADPFEGSLPRRNSHSEALRSDDACARVLVSCWHANESESAAMWRIYLKSDEGVALQTTAARLAEAFGSNDDELHFGMVRYLDYQRDRIDEGHELDRFFCKRKAFEYEREARVICSCSEPHPSSGRYIAADLGRLVERVVVSPAAEPWFTDLVRSVTRRYGFDFSIESSELGSDPWPKTPNHDVR